MAEDILDIFFSNTEAVEENNDDTSFAISKTDTNETSIMSAGNSSIHESSHKSTILSVSKTRKTLSTVDSCKYNSLANKDMTELVEEKAEVSNCIGTVKIKDTFSPVKNKTSEMTSCTNVRQNVKETIRSTDTQSNEKISSNDSTPENVHINKQRTNKNTKLKYSQQRVQTHANSEDTLTDDVVTGLENVSVRPKEFECTKHNGNTNVKRTKDQPSKAQFNRPSDKAIVTSRRNKHCATDTGGPGDTVWKLTADHHNMFCSGMLTSANCEHVSISLDCTCKLSRFKLTGSNIQWIYSTNLEYLLNIYLHV